jgi:hypothetical protein
MGADPLQPFLEALRESRLLDPAQWEEVQSLRGRGADARALARELVRRGWLTPYQANQVARGGARTSPWGPTSSWSRSARAAWAGSSRPATRS